MKNIIKLEEFGMLALAAYGLYFFQQPWWVYVLILFGPDISMLGYLAGNKVGAFCYNIFHHKGIAIIIFLTGMLVPYHIFVIAGIILFGHSSLDRMLGYGLKLNEGFRFTHLGKIGKEK